MAQDEDPVDEVRSVGMTSAAALSRVAETMIRAAQDHKMRSAQQAAQEAEEGQRRYDAQAQVAERFYREALDQDLMTTSPPADQDPLRQGAERWAELDPERFGAYADRLSSGFEELDLEEARHQEAAQEQWTAEAEQARAERENDPEKAAEHRERRGDAAARADEANQEADRHGQAAEDLEPVGQKVEASARSTSKSAVSRRFVAATETALGELLSAPLGDLDLVAWMIDGVHFGEHLCVVALGIGIDGIKHPLGLAEGSTENTSVVTDLLTGLRDRGLDTSRAILVDIDGGKALRVAVLRVFDHPVIQRCQLHKIRNVADKLPDHLASTVTSRMRAAYHAESALAAEAQLQALAKELERTHPGAAGSVREGLAETLTVLRLTVPPTLARTLRSINSIESMISIARTRSANVKNWQNGNMALRWCAAGMIEARGQFRRVNGHLHLPALRTELDAHVAALSVPPVKMTT